MSRPISISDDIGCRLWVDGLGSYLFWFTERLMIGNSQLDKNHSPKLAIMADLRTNHAEIRRTSDCYSINTFGKTSIAGSAVDGEQILRDNTELKLGEDVRLRFRIPSLLSHSAILDFVSDHRPQERTDSVILFDGTCIIDQTLQAHISCSAIETPVVLFTRENHLWAKSQTEFQVSCEGKNPSRTTQTVVKHGTVITGEGWQFRAENLHV